MLVFISFLISFSTLQAQGFLRNNVCEMNAPSATKPMIDVSVSGQLDLGRLPGEFKERALKISSRRVRVQGYGPRYCSPMQMRAGGHGECRICLKEGGDITKLPIKLPKKIKFGGLQTQSTSFRCGEHDPKDIQAFDLISEDALLKKLDAIRNQDPSPLQFQRNGKSFEDAIGRSRMEMFLAYDRCLRLDRKIHGYSSSFDTDVYGCIKWLEDKGRTLPKFKFAENDSFDALASDRFDKKFGYWTQDLLKLSCKKPNFQNFSFPVIDHQPNLEILCYNNQGISEADPVNALAFQYEGSSSIQLAVYSNCADIEPVKGEATGKHRRSDR